MYSPDDTGVYTDTAEFTDIIPECTNISVGYDHEHSQQECLNIHHYELLSQAVLRIQWDLLPTDRDPTVPEYKETKYDTNAWWTKYDSKAYDNKQVDSKYFGHWQDDKYWETEDLLDALVDALEGSYDFLLELISEEVYPEDPLIAKRFLSRRLLTKELLQEAITMAETYDASTVLCTLFDAIHCEA
jgi:glycerophosphoryl diester phosphodiesterase